MFISKNQFSIFIACVAFGCCIGIITLFFDFVKRKVNRKILKVIIDVISFIITAIAFSLYSFSMNFPSLRLYMLIGVLGGIYICRKSLYILLAKITKKFYNILIKIFKLIIKAKDERVKIQKNYRCVDRGGSIVASNTSFDNGLPTHKHKGKKRRRSVFNPKNCGI